MTPKTQFSADTIIFREEGEVVTIQHSTFIIIIFVYAHADHKSQGESS